MRDAPRSESEAERIECTSNERGLRMSGTDRDTRRRSRVIWIGSIPISNRFAIGVQPSFRFSGRTRTSMSETGSRRSTDTSSVSASSAATPSSPTRSTNMNLSGNAKYSWISR